MAILIRLSERVGQFGFWRILTSFWTLVFFAAIGYDFLHENVLADNNVILTVAGIYCASLAVYSAEKEFRRWRRYHDSFHPGELYAVLWTLLILVIIGGQALTDISYRMPPEVSASYIAVISILAITRESKTAYRRRRGKKA